MHMADALLSPAVGGTMLAVSAGVLACSVRDVRKNFQESRIPLMGVAGADKKKKRRIGIDARRSADVNADGRQRLA